MSLFTRSTGGLKCLLNPSVKHIVQQGGRGWSAYKRLLTLKLIVKLQVVGLQATDLLGGLQWHPPYKLPPGPIWGGEEHNPPIVSFLQSLLKPPLQDELPQPQNYVIALGTLSPLVITTTSS